MKILAVNGSARKGGNTEILLSQILAAAAAQGAETSYIVLDELKFGGCKGCLWCQRDGGGKCIQKDDLAPLYAAIAAADAIVIGSPVYFSTMTAQMKLFLDRLYPFYGRGGAPSRLPKGIKLAMVYTQGQPDPAKYAASFGIAAEAFRLIGFTVQEPGLVAFGISDKGLAAQRPDFLAQAKALGEALAQG